MNDFKNAFMNSEKITGWLAPIEAEYLYNVGFNTTSNILEVGTYFGKSTYLIAQGMKDANKDFNLITIDIHSRGIDPKTNKLLILAEDSQLFLARTLKNHGLDKIVVQMIGWSDVCISFIDFNKISTVFIDGGHDYDTCSKDFDSIRKKIIDKNRFNLIFHDYGHTFPGVEKTVNEFVKTDPRFRYINIVHSLFICEYV